MFSQHLLGRARRAGVADKVGAELAVSSLAEDHVFAENFDLLAVLDDRRQRIMCGSRFDRIVQLYIGEFRAADDPLLGLGRQRVPSRQIVQILLHDDVTAAGERGILLANQGRVDRCLVRRIFRSVNETEQIARIEIAEAVHLVRWSDGIAQFYHDLRRQLEAISSRSARI